MAFSRTAPELGSLTLSRSQVRFGRLKGAMRLRFLGPRLAAEHWTPPRTGGLYAVINADRYFEANRRRHAPCGRPIRWLVVTDLGDQLIRVEFYTGLPGQVRPWDGDFCRSESFLYT